ncbi:hypothetical protein ACQRWP_16810 [Micromonospora trifolii]|uniref:hypothetical protein n=1 Tax=Micromonospora trifolii TaxID=2911208 RepID=UPI003D2F4795
MALPSGEELLALLASGDDALAKRALQRLCYAIEAGRRVDLTKDPRLYAATANLKGSTDLHVRRWLYKLIGLLRIEQLAPWLAGQLNGVDTDLENMSWAAGALHVVAGTAHTRTSLVKIGLDPDAAAVKLAAGYFRGSVPVEPVVLRKAMADDDPLVHRWISLRYGRDPSVLPKEVLGDLVTSSTASVAEYAVWAVHNDPRGRISDIPLHPQDFGRFPPNVRRWYLRVLLKNGTNLLPYVDLVRAGMSDDASVVREGLALGLVDVGFGAELASELADWYAREDDPVVQLAIARVMFAKRRRHRQFQQILKAERTINSSFVGQLFSVERPLRPSKIFLPTQRRTRKEPTVPSPLPAITGQRQENVYLLGIDTVDFSKRSDRQQYTIFRDLLDSLRHEDILVAEDPDDVAVLLTGDGVFVGFRQVTSRLSPIRLALRLRRMYQELRAYDLRFGVNSGPATWIYFESGGPQLISHAVNWTARVMSAAGANQILVSDSYYQQCVRPATDELPAVSFVSVSGNTTKHGEPLLTWQAEG